MIHTHLMHRTNIFECRRTSNMSRGDNCVHQLNPDDTPCDRAPFP